MNAQRNVVHLPLAKEINRLLIHPETNPIWQFKLLSSRKWTSNDTKKKAKFTYLTTKGRNAFMNNPLCIDDSYFLKCRLFLSVKRNKAINASISTFEIQYMIIMCSRFSHKPPHIFLEQSLYPIHGLNHSAMLLSNHNQELRCNVNQSRVFLISLSIWFYFYARVMFRVPESYAIRNAMHP